VVACIAAEEEAAIGERALTRATYSNYQYGGCCVCPTDSVSSVTLPGQSEHKRALTWASLKRWREVDNGAVWAKNLYTEEKRTRLPSARLAALRAKVAAQKQEILKAQQELRESFDRLEVTPSIAKARALCFPNEH
jgi:hypothetical protein